MGEERFVVCFIYEVCIVDEVRFTSRNADKEAAAFYMTHLGTAYSTSKAWNGDTIFEMGQGEADDTQHGNLALY